jgi:hypothetical protein
MSAIIISLGPNFVDEVMGSVQIAEQSAQLSQTALRSLKSGRVVTAADEAWGKLKRLLNDIAGRGLDYIQSPLAAFEDYLGRLMAELEEDADALRQLLRDKIREATDKAMDSALKHIRSRVTIGGDVFMLTSITLQIKVAYTASMEVSLTALCRFIAAGEVVATGTYSLGEATGPIVA